MPWRLVVYLDQKKYDCLVFRFILLNFFFQATVAAVSPYTQILLRNKGYSYSLTGVITASSQVACVFLPILLSAVADKTRKTRLMFVVLMVFSVLLFVPAALSDSIPLTILVFLLSMGLSLRRLIYLLF